ncbi:DEAD/DEAH box helicase family protein [Methanocorpusculum sp. MG]|uniref:DEAD/DEAH box helicase family protein n=1 Tax=Methanocorpusculum petauri TaxID=3002863 RepID=A0ABT4IER1_9EURY|nr:DEAD/DEAH box helicase family protein [Methanocorpusculum petauri]MCZ0860071.1 DEAD/DEAH box helicase family protein [Methanocorpusculum petauri]
MNAIDAVRDEDGGKLFTCGHFDLIIIDEAHRSIYNKYKDIFTYFDAHLIGLTVTLKDEIDKNTYETFRLESGIPTYGYDLAQAVSDGYLVDFVSIETKLKFLTEGIIYDELTAEEKEEYEKLFLDENGELPEAIESSALNDWIFNADTIKEILATLLTHGIKVGYGSTIEKTIIFAKNHAHVEKIYEIFVKESAKEAISLYLQDSRLTQQQIYFLNRIVGYIVRCGMITDLSVLQGAPFTDQGTVNELFSENTDLWYGIFHTIEKINANARTA